MDSRLILVVVVLGLFSSVTASGEYAWTKWFDRDNPSGKGDYETLNDLRNENPSSAICATPVGIECQTVNGGALETTNDVVSCCPSTGLVCLQATNANTCADYRVRFLCPLSEVTHDVEPWTRWFDRDNPSTTGDWETVTSIYRDYPGKMCEKPSGVECQTTSGRPYRSTGEVVSCSADGGLVCKLADNNNSCKDYRVRFLCPIDDDGPWTKWFDRDNPSGSGDWETVGSLKRENPGKMCAKPTGIECQTTDGKPYTSTGETITCCAETGLICENKKQGDKYCKDYKVRFLCPGL